MTTETSDKKQSFAVFCKTFGPDIDRFARLLETFEQHNPSRLPFFVSIPREHRQLFHDRFGTQRYITMFDEDVLTKQVKRGWRSQQLVKLYAGLTGFADAWLWVDSDCYFARDFDETDFIKDGRVALICTELRHIWEDQQAEVLAYINDPHSVRRMAHSDLAKWGASGRLMSSWRAMLQLAVDRVVPPKTDPTVHRIRRFFGRTGGVLEYMPCAVWTRESLVSLEEQVLKPRGWTFHTLINFAPWEAIWIGEWELFRGAKGRFFIEPPLLHIRTDEGITQARKLGISERVVATRYLGLQLAARHQQLDSLDTAGAELQGPHA
jgi:hypothetical protein